MSNHDAAAASNMLYGFTYKGVWQKHNVPVFQRWIWTLSASSAIILLGCFALSLTFSQSRMWALLRYCVHQRHKIIRLDDDSRPDPLDHLSQAQAVMEIIPFINYYLHRLLLFSRKVLRLRSRSQSPTLPKPEPSIISPWFGIFAITNLALFGILGIALPVLLSEGVLGAPVVRSKAIDRCLGLIYSLGGSTAYYAEQRARADGVFDVCLNRLDHGCGSQYYNQQPRISKRNTQCPFPNNVCNDTFNSSYEITHSNITAYEFGLNSPSRFALSHRLTCSPIHLEPFLVLNPSLQSVNISVADVDTRDDPKWSDVDQNAYSMTLQTLNGPNNFSNQSSGVRLAFGNGKKDLTILPAVSNKNKSSVELPSFFIHKYLKRKDAESFLIIRRPGKLNMYPPRSGGIMIPVDDPFFAAHTVPPFGDPTSYLAPKLPDREATALGCIEQFQFCVSTVGVCTPWEARSSQLSVDMYNLVQQEQIDTSREPWQFFAYIPDQLSLAEYFRSQISPELILHERPQYAWSTYTDRWIRELETWFMKRALGAVIFTANIARVKSIPSVGWEKSPSIYRFYNENKCESRAFEDGILFQDPDFTNINWIGFWVTNFLLVLICIASYTIKGIDMGIRRIWRMLGTFKMFLWKGGLLAGKAFETVAPSVFRTKTALDLWANLLGHWQRLFPTFSGPELSATGSESHTSELQRMEPVIDLDNRHRDVMEAHEDVGNIA